MLSSSAMSTVDSLSTGIAVSASETTSPGPVLNNQSPPESEPTRHDVRILEFSSALLRMRTFGPALVLVDNVEISSGPYIECDLKWFNNGIEYSSTYFKRVFPAGYVIIIDARIKMKSILYLEFGSHKEQIDLTSHATSFLSELDGISAALGQPVERGKSFFGF